MGIIKKKRRTDAEKAKLCIVKRDSQSSSSINLYAYILLYLPTLRQLNSLETLSPVGCPFLKTCVSLLHDNKGYGRISAG